MFKTILILLLAFSTPAFAITNTNYVLESARSLTASFNGNWAPIVGPNFAIQCDFSLTPTGTLFLQSSNNPSTNSADSGSTWDWDTISGSSIVLTTNGTQTWNYSGSGFAKVRVAWTGTGSPTGVLNCQLSQR